MQAKRNGKFIKRMAFFVLLSMYMVSMNSLAQKTNVVNVAIQGAEAKKLFSYLTGPKVHADAGMSKQYLQGINAVCQYVTAPITNNGINVPMGDPSRYSCSMNFDYNGSAAATTLP
ncbi:MAG: hypothetical protein RJA25_397 [Bacteroidota bacterium]|jgi:hypothetical protein